MVRPLHHGEMAALSAPGPGWRNKKAIKDGREWGGSLPAGLFLLQVQNKVDIKVYDSTTGHSYALFHY